MLREWRAAAWKLVRRVFFDVVVANRADPLTCARGACGIETIEPTSALQSHSAIDARPDARGVGHSAAMGRSRP